MESYGKELIMDLHNCNASTFTRESIRAYLIGLCKLIDMKRCDLHFWDDLETPEDEKQTEAHMIGTTAVQFILTSNIIIHTLDDLKCVYINIFSCKEFDSLKAQKFTNEWFGGGIVHSETIERI